MTTERAACRSSMTGLAITIQPCNGDTPNGRHSTAHLRQHVHAHGVPGGGGKPQVDLSVTQGRLHSLQAGESKHAQNADTGRPTIHWLTNKSQADQPYTGQRTNHQQTNKPQANQQTASRPTIHWLTIKSHTDQPYTGQRTNHQQTNKP